MKYIVVVDLDGTIADLSHRLHYIKGKNKDWESFYDEVDKDKPIENIIYLISVLHERHKILFLTGRSGVCSYKTNDWIEKHLYIPYMIESDLMMRKEGDHRPDTEVKPELLKKYLKYNPDSEVAFILDDRNSMVKKWRELGFTCLQVNEGDF